MPELCVAFFAILFNGPPRFGAVAIAVLRSMGPFPPFGRWDPSNASSDAFPRDSIIVMIIVVVIMHSFVFGVPLV